MQISSISDIVNLEGASEEFSINIVVNLYNLLSAVKRNGGLRTAGGIFPREPDRTVPFFNSILIKDTFGDIETIEKSLASIKEGEVKDAILQSDFIYKLFKEAFLANNRPDIISFVGFKKVIENGKVRDKERYDAAMVEHKRRVVDEIEIDDYRLEGKTILEYAVEHKLHDLAIRCLQDLGDLRSFVLDRGSLFRDIIEDPKRKYTEEFMGLLQSYERNSQYYQIIISEYVPVHGWEEDLEGGAKDRAEKISGRMYSGIDRVKQMAADFVVEKLMSEKIGTTNIFKKAIENDDLEMLEILVNGLYRQVTSFDRSEAYDDIHSKVIELFILQIRGIIHSRDDEKSVVDLASENPQVSEVFQKVGIFKFLRSAGEGGGGVGVAAVEELVNDGVSEDVAEAAHGFYVSFQDEIGKIGRDIDRVIADLKIKFPESRDPTKDVLGSYAGSAAEDIDKARKSLLLSPSGAAGAASGQVVGAPYKPHTHS